MVKEKVILGLFLLICVLSVSLVYSQAEPESLQEQSLISVEGRLALEKHDPDEWLVLHAQDAQTYLIIGNLKEKLKNSLLELGQNNLVSVTGTKDGRSLINCTQSRQYEYNKGQHKKELKIDTKCIRYYNLEVTQILFAKQSDDEIPPPKRDIEAERRMVSLGARDQSAIPAVTGEIYGTVSAVNLKSPIKTVEIANLDKEDPLKKIVLLISANTRIAKKIGEQEPMALSEKALKPGQWVTAVYFRDEFKAEALFITVTKE